MILDDLLDVVFGALPTWAQVGILVAVVFGILAVVALVYPPELLGSLAE
jgi:hypothetical protein